MKILTTTASILVIIASFTYSRSNDNLLLEMSFEKDLTLKSFKDEVDLLIDAYGESDELFWVIAEKLLEEEKFVFIDHLVGRGMNINCLGEKGITLLHHSVRTNKAFAVRYLISRGANVNLTSREGSFPLLSAVFFNYDDLIKELIDAGADVSKELPSGINSAYYAAYYERSEILNTLTDAGLNINSKNKEGFSILTLMAVQGRYDSVKLLIQHGAIVELSDLEIIRKAFKEGFTSQNMEKQNIVKYVDNNTQKKVLLLLERVLKDSGHAF